MNTVFSYNTGGRTSLLWVNGTAQVKDLLEVDLVMPLPWEEALACTSFSGIKEEVIKVDTGEKKKINRFYIKIIVSE